MIQKLIETALSILVISIFILFPAACIFSARNQKEKADKCFRILKYVGIALLVAVLAFILNIALPILKEFKDQNLSGEISDKNYLLFVITVIGVMLLAALFILLPVILIRAIGRISISPSQKKQMDKAIKLQEQSYDLKEKDMDVWKAKHKRIRCPYCGTYNYATDRVCNSCGAAVLQEKK